MCCDWRAKDLCMRALRRNLSLLVAEMKKPINARAMRVVKNNKGKIVAMMTLMARVRHPPCRVKGATEQHPEQG